MNFGLDTINGERESKIMICISSYAISIKWIFEVENQQEKGMDSPYGVHRTLLAYRMSFFWQYYLLLDYGLYKTGILG